MRDAAAGNTAEAQIPIRSCAKAAERKEKSDAMEAQLELESINAAIARATAVAVEVTDGNDMGKDLENM